MTMDRVNAILANEEYKDWMEQIRTSEKNEDSAVMGSIIVWM